MTLMKSRIQWLGYKPSQAPTKLHAAAWDEKPWRVTVYCGLSLVRRWLVDVWPAGTKRCLNCERAIDAERLKREASRIL